MALKEGPEADGRHPDIDVLSCLDLNWFSALNPEPDSAMYVREVGLRTARPEETVLVEDNGSLDDKQKRKQPGQDV